MSLPEGLLWRALRARPEGLKFRRQHPIGPYIADFYCPAAKLIVEVDGQSHDMGNRPGHDVRRDEWLTGRGLKVLRVPAAAVLDDVEAVVASIVDACR